MFIRGDLVVSSSDTQNNAQPIFSVFLAQESHLIWSPPWLMQRLSVEAQVQG